MRSRTSVLAASLAIALAAGPLAAPALATSLPVSVHDTAGPDAEALRAALAGLPDADATEATRRVLLPAGMRDTYFPGTDPRIRGPHNLGYQAVKRADGTPEFVDVTD